MLMSNRLLLIKEMNVYAVAAFLLFAPAIIVLLLLCYMQRFCAAFDMHVSPWGTITLVTLLRAQFYI